MSQKKYVVLGPFEVNEASVHAGFYSVGLPAQTAVAGLVHFIERALQPLVAEIGDDPLFDDEETLAITSFAAAYSDFRASRGAARRVNYQHEHGSKRHEAASLVFDPIGDFTVHLVLEVETTLSNAQLASLLQQPALGDVIAKARFAGGNMSGRAAPQVLDTAASAFRSMSSQTYVLEDATETLRQRTDAGVPVIDAMAELISRPTRAEGGDELPYEPRYVPVGIGYRALETPQARDGRRSAQHLHCFVEPVIGLARLRLAASAAKALDNGPCPVLWSVDNTLPGYFLVKAASPN